MQIDHEFTVGVPIERAWALLTDLEAIAPCLPGAQLTGRDGDSYLGQVKIKVGPVVSEYAGAASFASKDDAAHRAVIHAKGRDSRGAGNAAAIITAQLRAEGDTTVVSVGADLKISGKIAQLGSSMIQEVSTKLLGQFVVSLEAMLAPAPEVVVLEAAPLDAPRSAPPVAAPLRAVQPEPEPLDLMAYASGAVFKRLLPVGAAVVVLLIVYVLRRRR